MVYGFTFGLNYKSTKMNIQPNRCLECGEVVLGRVDKKFCSDNCRSAYNNKRRIINQTNVKKVNMILVRNRSILYDLSTRFKEDTLVTTFQLKMMGFDFAFFTHQTTDRRGKPMFYCYDFGYQPLSGNKLKIIRNS